MGTSQLFQVGPSPGLRAFCLAVFYALVFVLWMAIGQTLYQGGVQSYPNRLDATLEYWNQVPIYRHWFLFFLSADDAQAGVPYANMPYFFSFFYAGYHIVLNALTLDRWPFATTYLMTMLGLFGSSWFLLRSVVTKNAIGTNLLLLTLAAGTLSTSPYVTAFLLQANHDTVFPFNAMAATVLSVAIWRDGGQKSPAVWVSLLYCSISGMLGFVTLACCFVGRDRLRLSKLVWSSLFVANLVGYFLPQILSYAVFGQTSSSGFLFRTGLDGSTEYFTSHWQAFFAPYAQLRSLWRELGVTIFVLAVLLAVCWGRFRQTLPREATAIGVAMLVYASQWVLFPQAISIHPYLFDLLYLIPIDLGIVMVIAVLLSRFENPTKEMSAVVSIAAVSLLLHNNLLLLSQGKFLGP